MRCSIKRNTLYTCEKNYMRLNKMTKCSDSSVPASLKLPRQAKSASQWFLKHGKQIIVPHFSQAIVHHLVCLFLRHRLHRPLEYGMGQCPSWTRWFGVACFWEEKLPTRPLTNSIRKSRSGRLERFGINDSKTFALTMATSNKKNQNIPPPFSGLAI